MISCSKKYVLHVSNVTFSTCNVQVQCKLPSLAENVLHVTNSVIEIWTAANSFCINSNKTQNLPFSLSCNEPSADYSVKLLGVASTTYY